MKGRMRDRFRDAWVQIHLWLGLTFGVVGVLIGITGSVLVFDHEVDARLNPQRYAVSAPHAALAPSEYMKRASEALDGKARAVNVRYPGEQGLPVLVILRERGESRAEKGAARLRRVYLDPSTARVLDVENGRGFVGTLHVLHENLMLRDYWGRELVGAVGFGMLISALSGIYLWWPLGGRWRGAFGFRKGFALTRNLHYTFGFYGSLILATLSFSGIYLALPDLGRAMVSAFAKVSPSQRGIQAPESEAKPVPVDEAVDTAFKLYPGSTLAAIGMPGGPRGVYRIALREPGDRSERGSAVLFLDPRTKQVLRRSDRSSQTGGDAFIASQRPIHTGEGMNFLWRVAICVVGVLPGIFVVTGTTMWLRKRRQSAA